MEINVEIIGLVATLFVLASFLTSGEKNIRIINIVGALIFVAYGLMLGALSVWLLNGILCFIHIYKLSRLKAAKVESQEAWKSIYVGTQEVQIKAPTPKGK